MSFEKICPRCGDKFIDYGWDVFILASSKKTICFSFCANSKCELHDEDQITLLNQCCAVEEITYLAFLLKNDFGIPYGLKDLCYV